jgi:predicted AlkP superfamily phosphohydrolase/phosphomutase
VIRTISKNTPTEARAHPEGARKIDDGAVREFGWEGGTVTQSSQGEEHRGHIGRKEKERKKERKRKA